MEGSIANSIATKCDFMSDRAPNWSRNAGSWSQSDDREGSDASQHDNSARYCGFSSAYNDEIELNGKEEKENPIVNERMRHSLLGESQSNSSSFRSFEANAAKEAQELAEFEILERDLANEKLLYNIENEQEKTNWHWQDLDETSDAARQSGNAEESQEPHFTTKASCSELSALSLDDSEPWVGNTTLGHQSLLSDSSMRMSTIEWHQIESEDTVSTPVNDTIKASGSTDGSFQSNLDQAVALKSLKQRLNANSRPQRKHKVAPTLPKQDISVENPDEEPSAPTNANQDLPIILQEKMRELEHEVEAYQRLSSQVKIEAANNRQEWQALEAAKESFEQHCEKETARMKQHMQQEHTRLEKEAISHERQWKARLQAAHCSHEKNKETRSQVETLRAQIVKMQLEERQQRQKYKANNEVLRQRVKELETQLQEMREEVRYLERERLQHWSCEKKGLSSRGAIKKKGRRKDQHTSQHESSLPTNEKYGQVNGNVWPPATPTDTILHQHQQDYDPNRYYPIRSPSTVQEVSEPFESSRSTSTASASASSTPTSEPSKATKNLPEHCFFQNDVHCDDKQKKQIVHSDQTKEIVYPDGNRKRINADGSIHIQFTNGDTKDLDPRSGKSVYYYAEAQTKLTTFADQTKVYEFPNHQIETNFPDGRTEIQFPDGIFKCIETDGMEVSTFPDGTQMIERPNGVREIKLADGQLLRYDANGTMTWLDSSGIEVAVDREQEIRFAFQAGENPVNSQ